MATNMPVYESSLVGEHNAMSAALLSAVDGLPAPLWWQCWHPSTWSTWRHSDCKEACSAAG